MERNDITEQIEKLKNEGKTVYSISRLNNYNTCPYQYHLVYNKKTKGEQNVYSILGGAVHDCIEAIYNGTKERQDLIDELEQEMCKCELSGINFPSNSIGENWKKDMRHFTHNFNRIDGRFITEKGIVFNLDGVYLQGYIDAITTTNDGKLKVLDWKTSSSFKGEKLLHAGRQLILYKLALEQLSSLKVGEVAWFMTKYIIVKYGNRQKVCSRRRWVEDISNLIKTDLKKMKMDDFIISMYIEQAKKANNLDSLPKEIQEKYQTEDCLVYYDITPELIEECKKYVKETVIEIESKNKENSEDWKPVEINEKTKFFCQNLCGVKNECIYYQNYIKSKRYGG